MAAVGLFGYAACRVLQGLLDPDRLGHDSRALGTRVGFVAAGVVHAALGWQAFRLYRGLSARAGTSADSRDTSEVGTTTSSLRTLSGQPGALGRWLLGVTAAGFVAYVFYEIIHARYLHIRCVR